MKRHIASLLFVIASAAIAAAQDQIIDVSEIAVSADRVSLFAPPKWKVAHDAKGDLNGDGKIDHAITLIEDKAFDPDDAPKPDRNRVLVVVLANGSRFERVAVADKLLQCTSCGGSFYGVMDAPVSVTISRGVLVVSQDHGSRDVSESIFRFRFDSGRRRLVLIGYDYNGRDRAVGTITNESTNYVTGVRITTTGKGKRLQTKRTIIKPEKLYLDDIDADAIEYAALERLGLG